jgi:hypothetical protein
LDLFHFQLAVFDVDNDDPLVLPNIVGECIVRSWAIVKKADQKKQDDIEGYLFIYK